MSDVCKWIFATILLGALITSPTLIAQETVPNVSSSDEQPETTATDGSENPQPAAVTQESSSEATEPDRPSARPTLAELMKEFRSLEKFAKRLRVIEQQGVTFDSEKTQNSFGMERVGQLHRVGREFVTRGNHHEATVLAESKAGPSTEIEQRIHPDSGTSVSERIPEPAITSEVNDMPFVVAAWSPKSDAEKAISRLVLVFFQDKARRAVPAVLIRHGLETIALTTSPATIVPENIEHAIDRTFLEFFDRENVPTTYADFSTPDLVMHVAKEQLTSFQLENPVTLKSGDVLSAILMHGQADLEVTPYAARVTAVDQKTTWQLPSHGLNDEFIGLIQIDQRLPEGTPLFKDGQLAGITLLGARFMKDDVLGSYVVPASRILEVLQQLKIE